MRHFTLCLPLVAALMMGSVQLPAIARQPAQAATKESVIQDAEYEAIARRIVTRVMALKDTYPVLANIREPQVTKGGYTSLAFEHGLTWTLDDPTKPAGKRNARQASYAKDGFWVHLQFYRGKWQGAAMFVPVEFGDLKLWFASGYRPGDDPVVIAAVAKIVDEEKKAFDAGQGRK